MVLLFSSWSWSYKQWPWSWSCYIGLGLKNLILFTSLSISEVGITGFVYTTEICHITPCIFSPRSLKRCKLTNAVIALNLPRPNFLDGAASCLSRLAVLSTNCLLKPLPFWPHLFCGAGHEKRTGEQLKWSLAFRLYIGSFHVHSYQDQFIQPGWAGCVFCVCIFSYRFVLCMFICPF